MTESTQVETVETSEANSEEQQAQTVEENNTDEQANQGESSGEEQQTEGAEAPETYAEFTAPEGVESLDTELLGEAMPLFKEAGLSQEQAQKLVDFYAGKLQASEQKSLDAFGELVDGWAEASKGDKEFGGDKFEESVKVANETLTKFGTPELDKFLKESGAGNHPEVIRLLYKVGKLMAEDVPGSSNPSNNTPRSRVDVLYPNS